MQKALFASYDNKALVIRVLIALLSIVIVSLFIYDRVGAVAYYGPEDTRTRYTLEHTTTTIADSLTVPIYFPSNPGVVRVYAGDFLRNTGGGTNIRVSFNGGGEVSSDTSFLVGGFSYDASSGWWRSTVTAQIRGVSGTGWRNYIHFRLELENRSGLIGYGGGSFQQASKQYYATSPVSNYSLYLATPCTVTSNQVRNIALYDLDNRNPDNGGAHIVVNVYNETTGQLIAQRDGDAYSSAMGQGGTLNIPVTFQPLHKYRVDIIGVAPRNVIQYNFPYDNIAYSIGCQWSVSGSSSVNRSTATIGDTVNWTHTLRNNGPHMLDKTVYSNIGMSGIVRSGWSTGVGGATNGPGTGVGIIRNIPGSGPTTYTRLTVNQNDVGLSLCEWIQYDPVNSGGTKDGRSTPACVSVPYNYSLTPSVSVPQSEVEVGSKMTVLPRVDNSGPTKSKDTQWQISYIVVQQDGTIPTSGQNSADPCVHYGGANRSCAVATFTSGGSGTGNTVFMPPSHSFTTRETEAGDLSVGTRVCYALSVRDRASNSPQWAHSAPDCAVVSKRPVVQVFGGDVISGRGSAIGTIISTNVKNTGGKRYGSWAEYGIVASGSVSGMASASGYAGGVNATTLCQVSLLTFSNKEGTSGCSDARIGRYVYKSAASTIAARFPVTTATAIAGDQDIVDDLTEGVTYTNNASNDEIRITSKPNAQIPAGRWVVVNAPGATVKIMSNIVYTTEKLNSIGQIPQVVIIARNIVIAEGVTQVDAWLVATGTGADGRVNTCGTGASADETTPLSSEVCKEKLTVNGPVTANHLVLRRTAGAGTNAASGDPAEVFNLRPDAYLWAANLQAGTAKAQTVRTTELPPRY